jgi:hypothetical protein
MEKNTNIKDAKLLGLSVKHEFSILNGSSFAKHQNNILGKFHRIQQMRRVCAKYQFHHIESNYLVSNVLPILGLNKYLLFICQSSQKKKFIMTQYNKRCTNPIGMWSNKFVAKFLFYWWNFTKRPNLKWNLQKWH